jgi:hypothetical protein
MLTSLSSGIVLGFLGIIQPKENKSTNVGTHSKWEFLLSSF